ncbi:MAG: metallopeptidase family protein [Candidatus Omnitrophota bacterium]
MTRKEFEVLVRKALRSLPKAFKDKLSNVGIVIEDGRAAEKDLLGLYEGVPLAERTHSYNMAMPDKITLFKRNLEAEAKANGTALVEEIPDARARDRASLWDRRRASAPAKDLLMSRY